MDFFNTKINSCYYCGSNDIHTNYNKKLGYWLSCNECEQPADEENVTFRIEEAINVWNGN